MKFYRNLNIFFITYEIFLLEFFTIICLFCGSQSINTVTYVSPIIKKEFILSLEDAWKLDDIANVHYATTSYGLLKEKIPISEKVYFI